MFKKRAPRAVYEKRLPLQGVLEYLSTYTWKDEVYIRKLVVKDLQTPCIVFNDLDSVDMAADGFTPLLAETHNMVDFLSVQELKSVVKNLVTLKSNPSIDEIFNSVLYYYNHDAFGPHNS